MADNPWIVDDYGTALTTKIRPELRRTTLGELELRANPDGTLRLRPPLKYSNEGLRLTPSLKRWALLIALNCMSANPVPIPAVRLLPHVAEQFHWSLLESGELYGRWQEAEIWLRPTGERHLYRPQRYSGAAAKDTYDRLEVLASTVGLSCTSAMLQAMSWDIPAEINPNRIRKWLDRQLEKDRDDQNGLKYLIQKLEKHSNGTKIGNEESNEAASETCCRPKMRSRPTKVGPGIASWQNNCSSVQKINFAQNLIVKRLKINIIFCGTVTPPDEPGRPFYKHGPARRYGRTISESLAGGCDWRRLTST